MRFTKRNNHYYLERKTVRKGSKSVDGDNNYRNWWLIKYNTSGTNGYLPLRTASLPKKFVGKRVRIKLEVIEEKN